MSQSQPGASSPRFRRGRIPGTMVLNWQPPETQASKPLIRRPMTACEACRAAKVKCNGQRTCERCRNRGLCCTYAPPPGTRNESREGTKNGNVDIGVESTVAKSPPRNSHGMSTASLSTSQATTDPMAVDTSPGDIFSIAGGGTGATLATNTASGLEHWQEETFNQALEQFDWVFPESGLGLTPSQDSGRNDFDLLQSPPERTASSTSDAHTRRSEAPTESTGLSPQTPSSSANSNCQCRVNMMAHIPRLDCAIQGTPKPQLDKIFKVTGDVIRSCLESTRCGCYVGPVDLVCIMTVFEQTAACFDYIAKSGFDGTVKVGIGDYCVSLTDDASLKRMLVLDLVTQANELLDLISARAQDMFVAQHEPGVKRMGRSPACLNQLNLDYVREATASFKKLFCLITDFFGENHSQK